MSNVPFIKLPDVDSFGWFDAGYKQALLTVKDNAEHFSEGNYQEGFNKTWEEYVNGN